jgi:hypothetical protein
VGLYREDPKKTPDKHFNFPRLTLILQHRQPASPRAAPPQQVRPYRQRFHRLGREMIDRDLDV